MERQAVISHTIGAVLVTVVGYFLFLYFVTPFVDWLLDFFGRWFIPERYGGGSSVDNPGIFGIAMRVLLLSGIAAWAAISASFKVFGAAHARSVAIALGFATTAWLGFGSWVAFSKGVSALSIIAAITVLLTAGPPVVFAYFLWKDESWK